jgi:predicted RNase H-like HicB family nuclease
VDVTFRVVLEHDPETETGDYSAVCSELPGCATAGETEAEARANIREAIALYLMPGDINLPEDAKLFDRRLEAHRRRSFQSTDQRPRGDQELVQLRL